MSFKPRFKGEMPKTVAAIVDAARDVLAASPALILFPPPVHTGAPQFFGLYRKNLHIIKTINEGGFQPHDRHADRTLAIAIAILVTDADGPRAKEKKWLDWADERGVLCYVCKSWGEFTHTVGELSGI